MHKEVVEAITSRHYDTHEALKSPLAKQVVLITGCSSGFGMLLAAELTQYCRVYATMRNLTRDCQLRALSLDHLQNLEILPLDVNNSEQIYAVMQHIREHEGRLDVIVNNAGYGIGGFFEQLSEEEIRSQIETNFFGVQRVTRAALPLLRETGGGKIVNISSIAGLTALPGLSAYNSSKWALEGFSEALRHELKLTSDIQVVLVEPGAFRTKIFDGNMKIAKNSKDPANPCHRAFNGLYTSLMSRFKRNLKDPEVVILKIGKIIRAKHPSFRYRIGWDAHFRYWMRWFLPFFLYEKIILHFVRKNLTKLDQ